MYRSSASRLNYAPKVLETSYHQWRSITKQVMESGVLARGNTLSTKPPVIKHSLCWTIIPITYLAYFTLRSVIVLAGYMLDTDWIHSSLVRLILGIEVYPADARFMLEVCIFFCSLYSLVGHIFLVTRKLEDFRFLALLAIDKHQTIKPSVFGLNVQDYHKVAALIESGLLIIRWINLTNVSYSFLYYYTSWLYQLFRFPLLPLTLFHILGFHYWIAAVASTFHYNSLALSIVVYYHRLKAASIFSCFGRFNDCLRQREQTVNENYDQAREQLHQHSQQTRRLSPLRWQTDQVADFPRSYAEC